MVTVKYRSPERLGLVSHLECMECGTRYTLADLRKNYGTVFVNVCDCFGPLDVRYDMDAARRNAGEMSRRPDTFWKFRELMPVNEIYVDRSRPFTPLRKAGRLGRELGVELYLKLDSETGITDSFKDRPVAVAFNCAMESGYDSVCVASTGSLAVSTAYYAKKFGFDCFVIVPRRTGDTAKNAIRQFLTTGLIEFDGSYDAANMQVAEVLERRETQGKKPFIPNDSFRPVYKEGSKTSGMEIATQIQRANHGQRTVNMVYPIGSGALFCSAHKGVEELRELGIFHDPVKMWGVQPEQCAPIVNAISSGTITPIREPNTIAKSIAIGNPGSGHQALGVMQKHGGGWAVSEKDMLDFTLRLYETEGIFSKMVGGAVLAGVKKGVERGDIRPGDVVVANITASGKNRIEDDLLEAAKQYGFAERATRLLATV